MNPCGSVSQNSCASLRPGFQSSAAAHSINVSSSARVIARMASSLATDLFVEFVARFLKAVGLRVLLPRVELLRLGLFRALELVVSLQQKEPRALAVAHGAGAL